VAEGRYLPSFKEFFQMGITFCITVLAWIFFRSENLGNAFNYIATILSPSFLTFPQIFSKTLFLLIVIFMIIEWLGRDGEYAMSFISKNRFFYYKFFRWSFYTVLILIIYFFGNFSEEIEFIYFQF
jgi:hypothetical protein